MKRVYSAAEPHDGVRVLIDGLWPRGVKRTAVGLWVRYLAPSTSLRKWFLADRAAHWEEFRKDFEAELNSAGALQRFLAEIGAVPVVTLLFASSDEQRNHAIVLAELLTQAAREGAALDREPGS